MGGWHDITEENSLGGACDKAVIGTEVKVENVGFLEAGRAETDSGMQADNIPRWWNGIPLH